MGEGPFYLHYKPIHLCYFSIPETIKRLYHYNEILLDNGQSPTVGVAAAAKKPLAPGTVIERGIGSFEIRGEAVEIWKENEMVPVGLMSGARIKRAIEPEETITFNDVEIPESQALKAWQETLLLSGQRV